MLVLFKWRIKRISTSDSLFRSLPTKICHSHLICGVAIV